MTRIHRARGLSAALVLLAGATGVARDALADEVGAIAQEVENVRLLGEELAPTYLKRDATKGPQFASERLIDGENLYRLKDYQRATIVFLDVIENYSTSPAYPDALFLYADSLFLSRDYLGARDWFRRVMDEGHKPGMGMYLQRTVERLIEIAVHLQEYEGIEKYIDQLGRAPTPEALYVKGKYYYFRGNYEAALQAFNAVKGDPLVELKALYLTGVIMTQKGQFDDATSVFLRGQGYEVKTNEEREIVDLVNLGAGRLFFEQGAVEKASECYQRVAQNSPYFDSALYEAAAVLIRTGDTVRAEQTLEVLTVALPDSKYLPRAKMLRGNLLLRAGRYDDAEKVFEELVQEFTPVMDQIDSLAGEQRDTRQFFHELVNRSLVTLDVSSVLPPLVVKWVSDEPEVIRALELATDIGSAKEYVRETQRLIRLLEAVINGPSKVNAIPILRNAMRKSQQLANRLGKARDRLGRIAEEQLGAQNAELARLRTERQTLAAQLAALPTTDAEYEERDKEARRVYSRMRQELSRNTIRIDQLSAKIVAIETFIADPRYTQGLPPESVNAVREELKRHTQSIDQMREDLSLLQNDIDSAGYQIGVGDTSDEQDAKLKKQIVDLARRERELLQRTGGDLGARLEKVYAAIDQVDQRLARFEREVESEAARKVEEIIKLVGAERDHVASYETELRGLDDTAEEVVGGVAFENFANVKKRFHELVLKADVGIIDVAWLKKEEHTSRITELTKSRLHEIKVLDDEFQEVKSGVPGPTQ